MKRIYAGLIIAFSLMTTISAQEAPWYFDKTVKEIQFNGIARVAQKDLDPITRRYVGKAFSETAFADLQQALYELDYFETILPNALPGDVNYGSVIIRFDVKEKPVVDSIVFEGNAGVKNWELLDAIQIKTGDIINRSKLISDEAAILKLLRERGYSEATVTSREDFDEKKKGYKVVFTITEGFQLEVSKISFEGNTAFSESTLKAILSLKEPGFLQNATFQDAKYFQDREAVKQYYAERGFIDVEVIQSKTLEDSKEKGKRSVTILFSIKEGTSWSLGEVSFSGNKIFDTAKLNTLVWHAKGTPINKTRLDTDFARVSDLYYENGYIFNQFGIKEARDTAKREISYTIEIVERERAHIESIVVKGNSKTKDHVILREIPLESGDIFSKTKIIEGLRNLYNLQYFSSISPETPRGSAENLVNLILNVEEQSTADINFGITFSGIGQADTWPVSGQIKWNDSNFFGFGQTLSLELNMTPDKQSLTLGFSENWLFDTRWFAGFSLGVSHDTKSTYQDIVAPVFWNDENIPDPFVSAEDYAANSSLLTKDYLMNYDLWKTSFGLNTGYIWKTFLGDVRLFSSYLVELQSVVYDSTQVRPYLASLRKNLENWVFNNELSLAVSLNGVDYSYNPQNGHYLKFGTTLSGILADELEHYLKFEARADYYWRLFAIPLSDWYVFKGVLGIHSGYQALVAQPWRNSTLEKDVSTDWLYLDGQTMARGWTQSVANGTEIFENWLEFRIPILDQYFWLDSFFDVAALNTPNGLLKPATSTVDPAKTNLFQATLDNFTFSFGSGLRISIPQLPLKLFVVKGFSFENNALKWKKGAFMNGGDESGGVDIVLSFNLPLR